MFALFFSLYLAMFRGYWQNISFSNLFDVSTNTHHLNLVNCFNTLGELMTSIFNDGASPITNFGDVMINGGVAIYLVSFILALITSIGIVVMAVKGVKKAFGIFFGHIR